MDKIAEKLISVEKARELESNWKSNQGKGIEGRGLKDVREFLFDLEALQEYINHVRTKSVEQGIQNPGIRIYFGAYAEDRNKVSTVFLAPTKSTVKAGVQEEEVANNYEISPLNTVIGGYPPINY